MFDKISNFKLAEFTLKSLCKRRKICFIDIPINFEKIEDETIINGLNIGRTKNIAHTIFKIVSKYIEKSPNIFGRSLFSDEDKRQDFLINFASNLRSILYEDGNFSKYVEDLTLQNLYQRELIWLLMKDLICPIYKIPLKFIKIVTGTNPYIDIARYYEKGEIKKEDVLSYPFIFVNEIENKSILNAFLFVETLKSFDLNPRNTLIEIFESNLYEKFKGILKLYFNSENKINEFISILIIILGIDLLNFVNKESKLVIDMKKYAQSRPETASQWWYLGVLERMLEPVRGADWSSHEVLKDYYEDFWKKVEEVKKKRQKEKKEPGIPFDELLRLKSTQTTEYKVDPTISLELLLSSDRIW